MSLTGWLKRSARSKHLAPAWEFQVRGIIWRLLPSGKGQFVGEERNIGEKRVSFFCIDAENGAQLWRDLRLAEPWWIGIEALHDDLVLLHEYAMPDFPDHKKIHALDLFSGKLRWSNEEVTYLFSQGNGIYAARDQSDGRTYLELDPMTGGETRELEGEALNALRKSVRYEERIDFPVPFVHPGSEGEDVAGTIAKLVSGAGRVHFIEYLRKKDLLGVAYYAATGNDPVEPLLDHHFLIAEEKSGRILYRDILNSRAAAAVPDAFFGLGDRFYSISEKRILRAFDAQTGSGPHG
ncbi:MAG TPA: DUF4905 domain-containing protein [Bacteroidota bacterium]